MRSLCSLPPRIPLATMLATRTATLQATKRALTLAPRSQLVSARAPAAAAAATRLGRLTTTTPVLPVNGARSFHAACRTCQEQLVKVPSMAESITEGTLKQWLKQKGDFVEADEEVATIETDKVTLALAVLALHSPLPAVEPSADTPCPSLDRAQIDVAVNAPSAGVLTDLLAQEEDTVTVGQDLFKLDTSASKPEGGGQSPLYTCCPFPYPLHRMSARPAKFGRRHGCDDDPASPAAARPKKCHDLSRLVRLTPSVHSRTQGRVSTQGGEEGRVQAEGGGAEAEAGGGGQAGTQVRVPQARLEPAGTETGRAVQAGLVVVGRTARPGQVLPQ